LFVCSVVWILRNINCTLLLQLIFLSQFQMVTTTTTHLL
jgi:hypothetical protein